MARRDRGERRGGPPAAPAPHTTPDSDPENAFTGRRGEIIVLLSPPDSSMAAFHPRAGENLALEPCPAGRARHPGQRPRQVELPTVVADVARRRRRVER